MVYNIVGNRYCHNIQREHKSNAVYYVLSLKDGSFTQRCFDPDCSNFRSLPMHLPNDLNPFVDTEFNFDEFDDEELIAELEKIEGNVIPDDALLSAVDQVEKEAPQ